MRWFRNLNALPKLVLSFGLLTLLSIVTGIVSLTKLSEESGRVVTAYSKDIEGLAQADDIGVAKLEMARLTRDALIKIKDQKAVTSDVEAFNLLAGSTQKNLDEAATAFKGEEGAEQIEEISRLFPQYVSMCKQILDRVQAGDEPGGVKALAAVSPIAKVLNADTAKAAAAKHRRAQQVSAASQQTYRDTRTLLIALISACALAGMAMSVWIGRLFSRPLAQAVLLLREVAEGNLTGTLGLDTTDEVGQMATALDEALERMRETLQEVLDVSGGVNSASRELASSSQSIASGAQEQAASLEETSASLEEITAAVRQSADNAKQASQLASGSKDSAEKGQSVVSDAVTAMAEINAASAKISDIISTIDEIAFQTNLLAVNAAVEAARAGEEGRGFAVVASEVRSLAQRSAGAAKEIKVLIQDTLRKVERGSGLVNKSGETLQGIVGSVKRVTDIVGEIAAASEEQSTGVEQVNTAMTQMDQVTQSNSAQTEELSSTAQALAGQAARLLEMVSAFKLSKGGKGAGSHSAQPLRPHSEGAARPAKAAPRKPLKAATSVAAVKSGQRDRSGSESHSAGLAMAPAGGDDGSFEEF
jgi:methyl-accepting chemotaxis protein